MTYRLIYWLLHRSCRYYWSDMCSPSISLYLFASTYCVCFFCVCVCAFPLFPFHSDLDRPVVCGSSGLPLFSCSWRYLSQRLAPSSFMFWNYFSWPVNTVPPCRNAPNPTCTHTFAFRDNTIAVCSHLGMPTVDPCARSTIGKAPKSIRSQLLCNWVRY